VQRHHEGGDSPEPCSRSHRQTHQVLDVDQLGLGIEHRSGEASSQEGVAQRGAKAPNRRERSGGGEVDSDALDLPLIKPLAAAVPPRKDPNLVAGLPLGQRQGASIVLGATYMFGEVLVHDVLYAHGQRFFSFSTRGDCAANSS
jgi:hypothetical protein